MEKAAAKERVNQTTVARFERWALPRMAQRLPAWMTPDKLTIIGLLAAALIGGSYVLTQFSLNWLWLASLGFVINWWGDSLDGTLARVRDIRRERYGFYVDHQSDAISTFLIFVGLGLSPLMELTAALFLIVAYYLMMIHVNLVTITRDVFKISFAGAGPTELRLFMITANTVVFFLGNPIIAVAGYDLQLFSLIGYVGTVVLLIVYATYGLIERAQLAILDPTPTSSTLPTETNGQAEPDAIPEEAPVGSR